MDPPGRGRRPRAFSRPRRHARGGDDDADPDEFQFQLARSRIDRNSRFRWRGETKFVVVAAGRLQALAHLPIEGRT